MKVTWIPEDEYAETYRPSPEIPIQEANRCECGHGAARHSDKPAGFGFGRRGYLCLIASCACYNFRPEKQQ